MAHDLAEVLCFQSCIKVGPMLPSAEEASCIFPFRVKLEIFGYLAWETKGERKKQALEEASGPASASAPKHKRRVIRTLDGGLQSCNGTSAWRVSTGPAGTRSCSVTRPDRMLSSTTSAKSVRHKCAVGESARGRSI